MLSVILLILKLIGILLASIIGIILLVICLVLFVPIRYRIYGVYNKDIYAKVKVHWLLHLICVQALYVDERLTTKVKLFGIIVYDSRRPKKEKKGKEKKIKERGPNDKDSKHLKKKEPRHKKIVSNEVSKKTENQKKENNLEKEAEIKQLISVEDADNRQKKESVKLEIDVTDESDDFKLWGKIKKIINKIIRFIISLFRLPTKIKEYIISFISKIKSKIANMNELIQKIKEFISDEIHKDSFFYTLKRILDLLKHLNPKKLQATFEFGFDDPYTTGVLLGGLSALVGFYGERVKLIPNFEEEVLKGDILAVGRIRLIKLLRIGIKVILYKNNRQLIKNIKTLKEEL